MLEIKLESRPEGVSLDSLVDSLERSRGILRDVDRVISARRTAAIRWIVRDVYMKPSPVAVLEGIEKVRVKEDRFVRKVSAGFVRALEVAEKGDALPPFLSETGLKHLEQLAKGFKKNGIASLEATLRGDGDGGGEIEATVSERSAANVERLLAPSSEAIGSIRGRLEAVSIHRGYRYSVWDDVSRRPVRCDFPPGQLDEIKNALGRRVIVAGVIRRNSKGQPLSIDRPNQLPLPDEWDLPDVDELLGLAPGLTDPMSTDDFVNWIRSA